MYKIEIQYLNSRTGEWKKVKHKLYESRKTFDTYWEYRKEDVDLWRGTLTRRIVGFENGKEICIYE